MRRMKRGARAGIDDWRSFWSGVWKERRANGIARRRDLVAARIQEPVELPGWLDELLTECREEFTPRQVEALVYRYGYGLTLGEAGDALGCSKQAFRKRLAGAEAKVDHLRAPYLERAEREALEARALEPWLTEDEKQGTRDEEVSPLEKGS